MQPNPASIPEIVLSSYGLNQAEYKLIPFGMGLINHTWKIETATQSYIIQRINQAVFKKPGDIAYNMSRIAEYLANTHADYLFAGAIPTLEGNDLVYAPNDGYFRMLPFVPDSHTIDVVHSPEQAFEAAQQFGKFTRLLNEFDTSQLRITIPSFHDLTMRYQQFLKALETGVRDRVLSSQSEIQRLIGFSDLVTRFESIRKDANIPLRVIHHDTKISNVLFNSKGKAICVIDLDTVMPGYFISDLGDMMRTYLSPVSEEEKNVDKIQVREDYYKAILEGYLSEMKPVFSDAELEHLFFAGQFMIYMQALRFLTDHLLGDTYYGAAYPGHNFVRATNQLTLLEKLSAQEVNWAK